MFAEPCKKPIKGTRFVVNLLANSRDLMEGGARPEVCFAGVLTDATGL